MKNYYWAKGYKYINVPVYLINFWKLRLFRIGIKRRRVGVLETRKEIQKLYERLLLGKV